MTVDVSKPELRDGDVVLIRGTVVGPEIHFKTAAELKIRLTTSLGYDIVSIEPRPLKVGDRVFRGKSEVNIRAIEGEWAWTTWPNSESGAVSLLSDLSPA